MITPPPLRPAGTEPAPAAMPRAAARRPRHRLAWAGSILLAVVLIVVAILIQNAAESDQRSPTNAGVGDCLNGAIGGTFTKVSCSGSHQWVVTNRVTNVQSGHAAEVCSADGAGWFSFWGDDAAIITVLCLDHTN